MTGRTVFLVFHSYEHEDQEDTKFIGAYATREDAEAAVLRLRDKPGFRIWPDDFTIDEHVIGADNWTSGFCILTSILVEVVGHTPPRWEVMHAEWRPGDTYKIIDYGDPIDDRLAFRPGQVVRCEERSIEGHGTPLVAVALAEPDAR